MKKSLNKLVAGASALCLVAALGLASCGGGNASSEDKTITVAASPTPHAQILEQVKPILENLSSRGLYRITNAGSREEADALLTNIAKWTHD